MIDIFYRLSLDGDGHERVEVNIQVPDVQDRNWTANYSWTPERETGKVPMLPKINEDCKTGKQYRLAE